MHPSETKKTLHCMFPLHFLCLVVLPLCVLTAPCSLVVFCLADLLIKRKTRICNEWSTRENGGREGGTLKAGEVMRLSLSAWVVSSTSEIVRGTGSLTRHPTNHTTHRCTLFPTPFNALHISRPAPEALLPEAEQKA